MVGVALRNKAEASSRYRKPSLRGRPLLCLSPPSRAVSTERKSMLLRIGSRLTRHPQIGYCTVTSHSRLPEYTTRLRLCSYPASRSAPVHAGRPASRHLQPVAIQRLSRTRVRSRRPVARVQYPDILHPHRNGIIEPLHHPPRPVLRGEYLDHQQRSRDPHLFRSRALPHHGHIGEPYS